MDELHFVFNVLHAGKYMSIRVFNPTCNNNLIAEVVHVFKRMQRYHQAGADG
jgi:hypothetical protein